MKRLQYLVLSAIMIGAISCSGEKKSESSTQNVVESTPAELSGDTYTVDIVASNINWEGTKLVGEGHTGSLSLASGSLVIKDKALVGGEFVVDMKSMTNDDLPVEGKYNQAALIGHLSNGDFFTVDSFPTSALVIKSVTANDIIADLTIKSTTSEVSFPYTLTLNEDGTTSATGKLVFDRTKFGVVYGSGNFFADLAKDRVINNDISLAIELVAKK